MELFLLEHKKLWRKQMVKICVLLCFVYIVIFGSILSFQWFTFGSSDDYTSAFGNNFVGKVSKQSKKTEPMKAYIDVNQIGQDFWEIILYYGLEKYYLLFRQN